MSAFRLTPHRNKTQKMLAQPGAGAIGIASKIN